MTEDLEAWKKSGQWERKEWRVSGAGGTVWYGARKSFGANEEIQHQLFQRTRRQYSHNHHCQGPPDVSERAFLPQWFGPMDMGDRYKHWEGKKNTVLLPADLL